MRLRRRYISYSVIFSGDVACLDKICCTLLMKVESSYLRSYCFFFRMSSRCSRRRFLRSSVFSCSCFSLALRSYSTCFRASNSCLSLLSSSLNSFIGLLALDVPSTRGGRAPSGEGFDSFFTYSNRFSSSFLYYCWLCLMASSSSFSS